MANSFSKVRDQSDRKNAPEDTLLSNDVITHALVDGNEILEIVKSTYFKT